jgi:hypothetical protein
MDVGIAKADAMPLFFSSPPDPVWMDGETDSDNSDDEDILLKDVTCYIPLNPCCHLWIIILVWADAKMHEFKFKRRPDT